MIAIRRFLALLLVLPFVFLFLATLLVFRVNATVLEPGFYTGTMDRLDAYNFIYEEVLPEALADTALGRDANALGLTSDKLVGYLGTALPPAWIKQQTELVLNEVVPYLNGDVDSFSITVRLDDRVEAASGVVREAVAGAGLYDYLLDEAVRPAVEEQRTALASELPLGMSLTPEQVMDGVRTVLTQEWLEAQVNGLLDQLVPYAVGQSESFSFTLPLQDRAEVGLEVLSGWVLSSQVTNTREYLLTEVLVPQVTAALAGAGTLPLGVTVTDAEVVAALGPVLSESWLTDRLNDAFDALGPYLVGRTEDFSMTVPLGYEAGAIAANLVSTIDGKYQAKFNSLPDCTAAQLPSFSLSLSTMPDCLPAGMSYEDVKAGLGLNVLTQLTGLLAGALPAEVTVTKDQLLGTFEASGAANGVEEVRSILRDGYAFDTARLESLVNEQLGSGPGDTGPWEQVQRGREWLRDGITLTQADLWDNLDDADVRQQVDDARGYIGQARSLLFLLLLVPLVLALLIGLLGGRTWGSRLAWAAFPVLVVGGLLAGAMFAVSGPLSGLLDDVISSMDAPAVVELKLLELRDALVDAFVNPLRTQGIVAAAVAVALMVVGIVLSGRGGKKAV
ncbi:MAG: hypothetical protein VW450_08540 [Chloroflexota bacterium]